MWAIDLVKAASGRGGSRVVFGRAGAFNASAGARRSGTPRAIRGHPLPAYAPDHAIQNFVAARAPMIHYNSQNALSGAP